MGSGLLENDNNTAQIEANILTNKPDRVKVLVEDEADVAVWYKLLNGFAPCNEYEIMPYSYDRTVSGKGKAKILMQADRFGSNYWGCVDSDYDWLLDRHTPEGQKIAQNQFLLQTFSYSIENLSMIPGEAASYMIECMKHTDEITHTLDEEHRRFLEAISVEAYDLLLWQLILRKESPDTALNVNWDFVFNNGLYNPIINDRNLTLENKRREVMRLFAVRCREITEDLERRYGHLTAEREELEVELKGEKGLKPENAWLFMRGHDLFEFMLYTFFGPVKDYLYGKHVNEIRENTQGSETGNAMKHYNNECGDFKNNFLSRRNYMADPHHFIIAQIGRAVARPAAP